MHGCPPACVARLTPCSATASQLALVILTSPTLPPSLLTLQRHRYIVRLLGVHVTPAHIYFVMEHAGGGTLAQLLARQACWGGCGRDWVLAEARHLLPPWLHASC